MNLAAYVPRSLTMNMPTDDLTVIQRRVVQVVAIVGLIATIAGAGVYGGRLLSSLDSLTASVSELRTEMRSAAQAATADRYELRALRDRVDRLERAVQAR